jgi:serine/threonine-protein kinase
VEEAVGPYRLVRLLGEGGMGRVFEAVREPDGDRVAVKLLKPVPGADEEVRRRFLREARTARSLEHPRLVGVLDAGEDDGQMYLVMRYVEGRSLQERIDEEGALPVPDAVRVAGQVAEALDALHAAGVVHRDVKAANVFLDGAGDAVLGDLGLARPPGASALTAPGQMLGTLTTMAPEMIRGEPAGPPADVYAFACVVFQSLTGAPPFKGSSMFEVGFAHLDQEPPDAAALRPELPPEAGDAIRRGLAKSPADRPASAGMLAGWLRALTR